MEALEARTRALLASPRLSEPTRRVLQARLDRSCPETRRALSPLQMQVLRAACLRLLPEPELVERTGLAAGLDARLAERTPKGWRYAESDEDAGLIAASLDVLDERARAQHGRRFAELAPAAQDGLLRALGEHKAGPLAHGLEELVTALVELYYAHPLVQVSIGYDDMADQGVLAVGLEAVAAEESRR